MTYPYQNPALSPAQRAADLLARMTMEEKVAQLHGLFDLREIVSDDGRFSPEAARRALPHGLAYAGGLGQEHTPAGAAEFYNALQRYLRDETRLGIPAIYLGEALHGFMALHATSFPQAIGLASAWNPELVETVLSAAAAEMRAQGASYALSPVLDIARDPRWGRTEETYGEDPFLAAALGAAAVRGLQGGPAGAVDGQHVLATAKHFAVHGQPEGGTNAGPANYAERIIREQFLIPFQAVVEAGVGSVMASYNEINGVPTHINPWLLKQVLRDEWGFTGFVISDGWGVDELVRLHRVAADAADAARQALLAGVDIELGRCFANLVDEVRAGRVPEAAVDAAAGRVLAAKFTLGLFEQPFADPEAAARVSETAEHRRLALEAARQAIVLLKNEGDLLPLDAARLRTLAVIGPNAAELRLGGYAGTPQHGVTILEGLRRHLAGQVEVRYAEGCRITETLGRSSYTLWKEEQVLLPDPDAETARIAEAVAVAREADVAVLVLGENEQTCREGWSRSHLGDRDSLDLPGRQEELLRAVLAIGTPTVLVLVNGRPLSIAYAAEHVPAILEAWYPGQEGGAALAEILFGATNPSGKLPITFPRSVGQVPAYYYHKPTARRGYVLSDHRPLFPFGHGLSYTNFRYANLRLDTGRIAMGEETTVAVDVTNSGARAGIEVAQLYVHDRLASLTRPVMELRGFQRVALAPGETRTVQFTLRPEHLSFLDASMARIVEPGLFDVMVGGSSAAVQSVTLEVVADNEAR
jgi:beta-glucosidase